MARKKLYLKNTKPSKVVLNVKSLIDIRQWREYAFVSKELHFEEVYYI